MLAITYNQLHALNPTEVESYPKTKSSLWAMFFVQDLLQIENEDQGLLLDVGWYPEADPTGCYNRNYALTTDDGCELTNKWFAGFSRINLAITSKNSCFCIS